jgi:pyridoxal phosphate enzyme (YggS family)
MTIADSATDIADIAQILDQVKAHIASTAREAGRDPAEITLVAVSKAQPDSRTHAGLIAGHRVFGENRIQEATGKWPAFKQEFDGVTLHLIGSLQTNKVRDAVKLFDVIETVDRPRLARKLAEEMVRSGRRPDCYVQVNTGEEPQKGGVLPGDADVFIAACRDEFELPVTGLMCIPPADEEQSLHFGLLREIARRNDLAALSMGMSADYEIAIQLGSTHVRVGTAIFGGRPPIDPPRN